MEPFLEAIPELTGTLGSSAQDAHQAAVAITTTGACPVLCAVCVSDTRARGCVPDCSSCL